ncbi:MAG: hypothetical protein E3J86_05755 [Candidatus Thorarchaeota archaeon]|nr:MAG: hypothetical protein E3J86_05755 [Candidatus Thorarchaeota archaeon]
MNRTRKYVLLVSVVSLLVFSGFILWSVTRASVPDDVKPKLGQDLIEIIQAGTLATVHDCIIACRSIDDAYIVIDSLPSESVEQVWELLGGFHAFLTPEQIFRIARMDEVIRIDYNAVVTIF